MEQYIVIGLGNFGASVARTLVEKDYNVLVIDKDYEKVQSLSNLVTHAVKADVTDEETLRTLGIRNFDVAVVSIGNDIHSNVLATLLLKELGVPYVIVKAQDSLHGNILTKVGADRIIYPERDMGTRIAHNLMSSNVLDYLEFSPDYSIIEVVVTDKMIGKSLAELKLQSRYDVNVVAIKRGKDVNIILRAEDSFQEGDVMIVFGCNEDLKQLRNSI